MNLKHENKSFEFSDMFESSSEESLLSLDNSDLLLVDDKKRSKSVDFIKLEPLVNKFDIKKSKSFDFIKIPFFDKIKYDNFIKAPKIGERKLSRSFDSVDSFKELIRKEEKNKSRNMCRKRDYEMFPVSKSPQINDVIKLLDYKISPLSPNNHIKKFGSYDDFYIDYE